MVSRKKIPRKSKEQVRKKRDTKKPTKISFGQTIYIGPGPNCEKPPKG